MKIIIKNIVCPACIFFAQFEMEKLGIYYKQVRFGEFEFTGPVSDEQLDQLKIALQNYSIEIFYEDKNKLVRKIKMAINNFVDKPETDLKVKLSDYISQHLSCRYFYLNQVFMEKTGVSIEWFYCSKKIERAIDLLMHYNLTLTEITYQLNYENVAHLTHQFERITGLDPHIYKHFNSINKRVPEQV